MVKWLSVVNVDNVQYATTVWKPVQFKHGLISLRLFLRDYSSAAPSEHTGME